jgi:hypothetical protein
MKKHILLLLVILATAISSLAQSRQRISSQTKKDIVEQLVLAEEIRAECVQEAGGAEKVVKIFPVDLNRDGKPEFSVEGADSCAYGARFPDKWIFRETDTGYELLLSAGPVEGVASQGLRLRPLSCPT